MGVCLGCMWFRLFFSDFCFLCLRVGFLCVVLSDFLGVFEDLDCEDFGNLEVMFGKLRVVVCLGLLCVMLVLLDE